MHEIAALCKTHKVNVLSVFGSAVGNKMDAHSDVDFLVRFSDDIDAIDYSDNYFSLLHELESLMGKRVDLLSRNSLKNAVLIAEIERTKVLCMQLMVCTLNDPTTRKTLS